MSKKNKIQVYCPECSHEQTALVWKSLNVTLNPEAKQELLNNRINILACSKCSVESPLNINLLYHDMEKMFCVMYIPLESVIEGNLVWDFDEYGKLRSNKNESSKEPYDYMKDIHVVFGMDELARYVIFRDKLFKDYKEAESDEDSNYPTV